MEKEEVVKSESEKSRLLGLSEIGLWLDTYDDIFSDFDPRPFSQRSMSVDFLDEIKRASKEKTSGVMQLTLMIPKDRRDPNTESQIKKRLHEHFKKHEALIQKERKNIIKSGILMAFIGMLAIMLTAYLHYIPESILNSVLFSMFEPTGWFLTWVGLDKIFYASNAVKPDLDFYKKMASCDIVFLSY